MIDFNKISRIGIGTYRMNITNKEHLNSLRYAFEQGINLIDTASNYQFGNSERLIGSVLNGKKRENTFIVTKAGYIQGEDINAFSSILNKSRTIRINDNFLYSIDSLFLESQIKASLKRLNTNYLDGFLIHNPEHYFDVQNENQKFIYDHLIESLLFLETLVKKGIIRYYGISSNTLPNHNIDLRRIINENNEFPNFKLTQFPYNLNEKDAVEKNSEDESLIDFCKRNEIITFANRPLNTTYKGKVLRLADYSDEYESIDFRREQPLFEEFLHLIKKQLERFGEASLPKDYAPIKFLIENRKKIANPEAVNQIVNLHLIPFLNQLQFSTDDKINIVLKELNNYWILYSKKHITERTLEFKKTLQTEGAFTENDHRDISLMACERYLNDGLDHILVGMRKKKYIDKLLPLI